MELGNVKTYVIHVSDDFKKEREMNAQLAGQPLDVEFILKGDKKDLSEHVLETYFEGNRKCVSNSTSCVYKHILAYEKIVTNRDEFALVLEDDIILYRNFSNILFKILTEIKQKKIQSYIISLEDSLLRYIPRSERAENKHIYSRDTGRYAGAYLIDYTGAEKILNLIQEEKCHIPMDWYHNHCVKKGLINIYWSQPTIALQRSHNGSIATSLDNKTSGILKMLSFYIHMGYKRLLYYFR